MIMKGICGECERRWVCDIDPKKCNEWPDQAPQTNADRIRAMSDEELAKEMLFFCPTDTVFKGEDTSGKPHYTGLDGGYYATSEEVVASNLEWLKQPAEVK
jgi:hypothetical protein